jgi:drug/metabolite transporter (DMT)-like permease
MTAHLAAAMMIGSGAAHAVVNAILKSGKDKMSSRALIDGFSAVLVLPFITFLPLPDHAWLWLLGSWLTHLIYLICLVKAFEGADMSAVYPVMRGAAPVLAAAGAFGLLGESISGPVMAGVGLVSGGTLLIALGKHASGKAVAWALATALAIATYTVIDAQGVRAAPSAPSYIAWVFLTMGAGVGGLFAVWRGPAFVLEARSQWKPGLAAGALSILTYGLALWAYRLGAVPQLAALREISILFAALIAVLFLKERITAARACGILAIGGGAILLVAAG